MLAGKACTIAGCQFAHSTQGLRQFPGAESSRAKAGHAVAVSRRMESMMGQCNDSHAVADMAQNLVRLRQAQEAIQQALASIEGRLAGPAKCVSSSASERGSLSQQSTSSELNIEVLSDSEYMAETVLDKPASRIVPEGTTSWGQKQAYGPAYG